MIYHACPTREEEEVDGGQHCGCPLQGCHGGVGAGPMTLLTLTLALCDSSFTLGSIIKTFPNIHQQQLLT